MSTEGPSKAPLALVWEELANPNLQNVHVPFELTREMKERYTAPASASMPLWVQEMLALEGVTEVDLLRHHIRLRKTPSWEWPELREGIERVLMEEWGPFTWSQEEPTTRKKSFLVPHEYEVPWELMAFEGVDAAQDDPLAQACFALPGVILVAYVRGALSIKRGACFAWASLSPELERILAHFSTPA